MRSAIDNPAAGRPHARRGNAMIMAVAMTVMLAIIGSSFVIMSRLDRQATRGNENNQALDASLELVLEQIKKVLTDDLVDNISAVVPGQPLPPAVANSLLDGASPPNNELASREPFDYPGVKDPWLASTEPILDASNSPMWLQVSEVFGANSRNVPAGLPGFVTSPVVANADTDGDGVNDAFLRQLTGINIPGKQVFAAVRIIDNCGMANVNTTFHDTRYSADPRLIARSTDPDSFGEFLHQVNLLGREGMLAVTKQPFSGWGTLTTADWNTIAQNLQIAFLYNANGLPPQNGWAVGQVEDYTSIWFDNTFNRLYELMPTIFYSPAAFNRPFGLEDEMELRYRNFLNSPFMSRLETLLRPSLVEFTAGNYYRTQPFGVDPADNQSNTAAKALSLWLKQMQLDRRHLLTTYSYDREIRPVLANASGTSDSDWAQAALGVYSGPTLGGVGRWRKINANTAISQIIRWQEMLSHNAAAIAQGAAPPYPNINAEQALAQMSMRRLALAITGSGYTLDQAAQYVANLLDYIDVDIDTNGLPIPAGVPFVIPQGWLNDTLNDPTPPKVFPSRDIYGTEMQPFISEVATQIQDTNPLPGTLALACNSLGIELVNPYPVPIDIGGWTVIYDTGGTAEQVIGTLLTGIVVPAASGGQLGRLVLRTGGLELAAPASFKLPDPVDAAPGKGKRMDLVRPVGFGSVIIDSVTDADVEKLLKGVDDQTWVNDIQRATGDGTLAFIDPPWGFARNAFELFSAQNGTDELGVYPKTGGTPSLQYLHGWQIPILNRGGVADVGQYASPPPSDALQLYRVNGWFELTRPLIVGNPAKANADLPTITQAFTGTVDLDKDGKLDPNANGLPDDMDADRNEALVRIDLSNLTVGKALFDHLSLVNRSDDGLDNDDGNSDTVTFDMSPPPPGLPVIHSIDDLLECRIPGRININTMSAEVFKAILPRLRQFDSAQGVNNLTESEEYVADLTNRFLERRTTVGPFVSVAEFINWLASFSLQGREKYFWMSRWPTYNGIYGGPSPTKNVGSIFNPLTGEAYGGEFKFVVDASFPPKELADSTPDFEERNWISARMANFLTVRSDTFTAYIQVRIQNTNNPADFVERRVVALLDRSNVFLPQAAATNGPAWAVTPPTTKPPGLNSPLPPGPPYYQDDSGEFERFDRNGWIYGPGPNGAGGTNDSDYFDRQLTTPKVVAIRPVPDVR